MATRHVKPGDWLALLGGAVFTSWLALTCWQGGAPERAIIRSGGRIFSEVTLDHDQMVSVPGPLGTSMIAIHNGQARVASDPSPRQYCVHQGWLRQAGEIAVCLPNQVSLELHGKDKQYDSLSY